MSPLSTHVIICMHKAAVQPRDRKAIVYDRSVNDECAMSPGACGLDHIGPIKMEAWQAGIEA